ncbi:MAG TPA: PAS domain S-box protein, partial [Acidobacteriota bacterium]|nr:PAS domain S-box protein [Acidobacteriota bacterium]
MSLESASRDFGAIGDIEQAFYRLFRAHPVPMWIVELETLAFLDVNDAAVHRYGFSREEFLAMTLPDIRPSEDVEALREDLAYEPDGLKDAGEWRHRLKNGRLIDVRITTHPLRFRGRRARLATAEDITDRKKAEHAAREGEARYRSLVEHSPDAIFVNLDDQVALVNRAALRLFGAESPEELLGKSPLDLFHPDDHPQILERIHRLRVEGQPVPPMEERIIRLDGRSVDVEVVAAPFPVEGRNAIHVILRDITGRKLAEAQRRLLQSALESADNSIVITSRDGVIEWANPAFSALTGYSLEEAIGRKPGELLRSGEHDESFYQEMWKQILAGNVWRGEIVNRRKDGSLFEEEMTIAPVPDERGEIAHYVAIKQDVSEEKQLRAQLLQAQKMESVGRLAGGIAHDFNNLLTVINGTAELAMTGLPSNDSLASDFREIRQAGERAAALIRQLLAFSRKQVMRSEVFSLNTVVEGMESILKRLIGEDIRLSFSLTSEPARICADPGQIEQVIMNLAINARDAMPDGGALTIGTKEVELDDAYAATHLSVQPGAYVLLMVSDTGCGMDQQTRERIFEPFFTTKPADRGTGLGLPTVYGIVKQSGGSIWVYSEVGSGTTFKIYLPVAEKSVEGRRPAKSQIAPVQGTETILVVEDDKSVLSLAVRVLESAGYKILQAEDGREALRLLKASKSPVHLTLTDVVMPGINGRELAERLRELRPETKVLFTSGYTDDAVLRLSVSNQGGNFL